MHLRDSLHAVAGFLGRQWRRWTAFEEAFWGPCASAIRERVNPDEWARVFVKAVSIGGATWYAQVLETWRDPDFQTNIVAPFVAGTLAAYIEYRARKAQGRRETERAGGGCMVADKESDLRTIDP